MMTKTIFLLIFLQQAAICNSESMSDADIPFAALFWLQHINVTYYPTCRDNCNIY